MTDKTKLTIKPNEVVRFQFDHSNYADLSIDIEGNLTVHNLCGKYPSIIDKTVYGITKTLEVGSVKKFKELDTTVPTDRPLKVGDVLVCTYYGKYNYTEGDEYLICRLDSGELDIVIKDDLHSFDYFSSDKSNEFYYKNYFTLKP